MLLLNVPDPVDWQGELERIERELEAESVSNDDFGGRSQAP